MSAAQLLPFARAFARALALAAALVPAAAAAQQPRAATRAIFIDGAGVIRWRDDRSEVALFGANYTLPSASDYRAAGYLGLDRKRLVDQDMAQFARLGWDALRLSFWGDWENADRAGNLVQNDHLDVQDYLVAKARERGIYILLSPITTYDARWPDHLQDTTLHGFSRYFDRGQLGTNPEAWRAQANYIRQLLEHVNPYTGVAYKDEPAILFVEPINEPWHHPEDLALSVNYIDALTDAVRSTGCTKPVFYNVSQDFAITEAIRKSKVQGLTFGWYPTGLNSGHELQGNYLRTVDHYDPMLAPALEGLPRIVYEFDSPDLRTGYMYPALARTLRAVGTQFAAMFAYDMQGTASRNLGWQTHYLSLAYTPRKALSAVIAAEAMKRLPRFRAYGPYPRNTRFGDFRVSYEENLAELVTGDVFLYTSSTATTPPSPDRLTRIAGAGSSPVVEYPGTGAYFLDRVRPGLWRLELYPDAVPVRDPFVLPRADKVVTRALYRTWPMRVRLPELGDTFTVQPLSAPAAAPARATAASFPAAPGVYLLSASGPVEPGRLPAFVGRVGLKEIHLPPRDTVPLVVNPLAAPEYLAHAPATIGAQVVVDTTPDSVLLFIKPVARGFFRRFPMRSTAAHEYAATIPADSLAPGPYQYAVSVFRGDTVTTLPEGVRRHPRSWDFSAASFWHLTVVEPAIPLRLFDPAADAARLAFSRIGDAGRTGLFRLVTSPVSGEPAFHLELPVQNGWSPPDYTASLVVDERVRARGAGMDSARALRLRLRGLGAAQTLHVTLVETDGTGWSAAVPVDSTWTERTIPLAEFEPARSVMLPQGFPQQWLYWLGPAEGRGGAGDALRPRALERLQFSLRGEAGVTPQAGEYGVEVESAVLLFR